MPKLPCINGGRALSGESRRQVGYRVVNDRAVAAQAAQIGRQGRVG